jgi:5,10-methylenetetrahydrofolate reductase
VESLLTPAAAHAGCPKNMEYGPCGGVDFDGGCEVADFRCVFLGDPLVKWHGATPAPLDAMPRSSGARAMLELMNTRPVVVADFPARAIDAQSLGECARMLAGSVDATLAGDSGNARVQFSPSYRASLIMAAGLPVWAGLNCRDRNRVALEGELAGLAHVGVAAVHCVTGDHTLIGDRPDAAPVFDLDSSQLASLARAAGMLVSVGESPATPPVELRPARLLEKQNAGAEVCFVNHCGGVDAVGRFVRESRDLGVTARFIACVPMVTDVASATLLRSFTTLVLPEGYLDRILSAPDPREEGIRAAVELSLELLEIDCVAGVNLSGGAGLGREAEFAAIMAETAERLAL